MNIIMTYEWPKFSQNIPKSLFFVKQKLIADLLKLPKLDHKAEDNNNSTYYESQQ